ncbi:unnamed protein product [Prunus armeniaca]|uniref:Uncharacterized protein n=1 Tax=Prunus armeniaca TaxID=36596 RepID=A0A6J5XY10_PRUAR|nr:unnamed protein product [Prunus armeniaca]
MILWRSTCFPLESLKNTKVIIRRSTWEMLLPMRTRITSKLALRIRGNISADEEDLIVRLHKLLGNRWSLIAGRIPGRTDNEIKNYWNTHLNKRSSSDQELLEHHKPSINPKNQHNEKGLIPSDQSHKAKAIRPKYFKCTKVVWASHRIFKMTKIIKSWLTQQIILILLAKQYGNPASPNEGMASGYGGELLEGYSPIIADVDPFEPNIDGEVAFNALSSFMNIEDYQYWIN